MVSEVYGPECTLTDPEMLKEDMLHYKLAPRKTTLKSTLQEEWDFFLQDIMNK